MVRLKILLLILLTSCAFAKSPIYDIGFETIGGQKKTLADFAEKPILIVNVASQCGYTPQYAGLQLLHEKYKEKGLNIIGFPCNDFGGQEPGTEEEIAEFCSANYGVTFPMFSKISVKGNDIHPLYAYLTESSGQEVSWNF